MVKGSEAGRGGKLKVAEARKAQRLLFQQHHNTEGKPDDPDRYKERPPKSN